jgi:spore coat protein JB
MKLMAVKFFLSWDSEFAVDLECLGKTKEQQEELNEMEAFEADSTPLLNELRALDYALVELTLYLNTHPYDENAIKQHNELAERRHIARDMLENDSEESSVSDTSDSNDWKWSLAPWPWQI